MASGELSGLGTSPEWGDMEGQACFHTPFPGCCCPEDLAWISPCFQALGVFLCLDFSPGNSCSRANASTPAWAEPCQTQLMLW